MAILVNVKLLGIGSLLIFVYSSVIIIANLLRKYHIRCRLLGEVYFMPWRFLYLPPFPP